MGEWIAKTRASYGLYTHKATVRFQLQQGSFCKDPSRPITEDAISSHARIVVFHNPADLLAAEYASNSMQATVCMTLHVRR